MKNLYLLLIAFSIGCSNPSDSNNKEILDSPEMADETEEQSNEDKALKITFAKELHGTWILLLKQADNAEFEIINPCNGSAGTINFGEKVSISSGQEGMEYKLLSGTKDRFIKVATNENKEQSFNCLISIDLNYLDIIPKEDFPTSSLFGSFNRTSFDSLLTNTGTKDTLHFVKLPSNMGDRTAFFTELGIGQIYLPCDEDIFD